MLASAAAVGRTSAHDLAAVSARASPTSSRNSRTSSALTVERVPFPPTGDGQRRLPGDRRRAQRQAAGYVVSATSSSSQGRVEYQFTSSRRSPTRDQLARFELGARADPAQTRRRRAGVSISAASRPPRSARAGAPAPAAAATPQRARTCRPVVYPSLDAGARGRPFRPDEDDAQERGRPRSRPPPDGTAPRCTRRGRVGEPRATGASPATRRSRPSHAGLGLVGRLLRGLLLTIVALVLGIAGGAYLWFHESLASVQAHSPAVNGPRSSST